MPISSGNGLLPDGAAPLSGTILTYLHWSYVTFVTGISLEILKILIARICCKIIHLKLLPRQSGNKEIWETVLWYTIAIKFNILFHSIAFIADVDYDPFLLTISFIDCNMAVFRRQRGEKQLSILPKLSHAHTDWNYMIKIFRIKDTTLVITNLIIVANMVQWLLIVMFLTHCEYIMQAYSILI